MTGTENDEPTETEGLDVNPRLYEEELKRRTEEAGESGESGS